MRIIVIVRVIVIVKLTYFIQLLLWWRSSMPTSLLDSPKSYWTASIISLPNGQDLSNCSKSSFTNCSHTESLCIISVLIQKFTEHISVGWKCPHTPQQIVLCHHSKSYFKQSSTQIMYQSSMLQDLSLQDLSHCPDPEYCYTQFIKLEVFTSTNPHYNHIIIISVEVSPIRSPLLTALHC